LTERQDKGLRTVKNYMWWSMGAGLIPVPLVDLAAVSGVQVKMLADVSKIYEVPFQESRGKAVIGSLLGFVLSSSLACGASSLLKAIPVVGTIVGGTSMAIFSGASAWALGNVFIQHFEAGGTFLNFKPEEVKDYFKQQFEEGQKLAADLQNEPKPQAEAEIPA
jgi:uncharacterized protein (DUF697 family)